MKVRPPVVAGAFYPQDTNELQAQIYHFLESVETVMRETPPIIIVPHAGYVFSGQVAAYGLRQWKGSDIKTVILLGNSHQNYFYQAALDTSDHWVTPLGETEVDLALGQDLLEKSSLVTEDLKIHAAEHSLEVQLPFLQLILNQFKIVPLLLGSPSKQRAKNLALLLKSYLNRQTVLVASSDLSHYPSYETANLVDKQTIESILSLDVDRFEMTTESLMAQAYPNLVTCACGAGAIKTAMFLARDLNLTGRLLKYANSGDVGGEKSRVVGYGAIAFS
ncbi:AmmeMemoRadiSam system protein B [candidate division CPR3 bacterium 4484_211]|uniref:MEMO1 family protein B5M47_01190 n=1 Tax=candidate division CPR3 bacterium 4484_211 TaxID=1968527 RepID=A0A1W9NYW6_UNCC3|nr:MAG: AmmeMemoRadiSam system protein B [candidate division CPR3 bacterium 4484_211]